MKAHIKIMRLATGGRAPEAEGTFGIMKLRGEAGLLLQTAELPDRDNEPFKSRIPGGRLPSSSVIHPPASGAASVSRACRDVRIS